MFAIVGLAGCKKNNPNTTEQQSTGEDTKISLSLSIASSGTKTYGSPGDVNATLDDIKMNTVDIFIYDKISPFALTHKHIEDKNEGSDYFKDGVNGERRLRDNIVLDAKTGDKLIYVGVNLPVSMVSQIKATQGLASLEGIFSAMEFFNEHYQEINKINGMAMFTNEGEIATFEKTEGFVIPNANQISFDLRRLLAKVTVGGTVDFNDRVADAISNNGKLIPVLGGSIDVEEMYYTLKQTNTSTYLKGNSVIPWIKNKVFFNRAANRTNFGSGEKYTPENLSENDLAKLTFAVVEARFIPEIFEDGNNYLAGDFYTLTDPSNGTVTYYIDKEIAILNASGKEFRKYTDGYCFYHIYLNPENDHKVVRNEYYQVKVSNIRGIGKSSQQAVFFESGDTMYNSEIIDPVTGFLTTLYKPQPASTNANIEATVTIVPWIVKASEIEL